jgi:hypothetical protein
MSLKAIEQAIEKVAFLPAGSGAVLKGAFSKGSTWKGIGTKAAIGAGVGAVGNVVAGDKDQSIAERALKGGVAGGAVGGLYGAGRAAHGALKSEGVAAAAANRAKTNAGRGSFVNNPERHGVFGNRTPEQAAMRRADLANHLKMAGPKAV